MLHREASMRMDHKDIWVHGSAYGKDYDFHCTWVSRAPLRAELTTQSEPSHTIVISPRYVGSVLGVDDSPGSESHFGTITKSRALSKVEGLFFNSLQLCKRYDTQ